MSLGAGSLGGWVAEWLGRWGSPPATLQHSHSATQPAGCPGITPGFSCVESRIPAPMAGPGCDGAVGRPPLGSPRSHRATGLNLAGAHGLLARSGDRVGLISAGLRDSTQLNPGVGDD